MVGPYQRSKAVHPLASCTRRCMETTRGPATEARHGPSLVRQQSIAVSRIRPVPDTLLLRPRALGYGLITIFEACFRRLRNPPCLYRSSFLCNRRRWSCTRPGPYIRSGLCTHVCPFQHPPSSGERRPHGRMCSRGRHARRKTPVRRPATAAPAITALDGLIMY